MALYPQATQRPWTPYTPERFITPRLIILHTNAVNSEDPPSTGGLTWHFQIGEHGTVYQHRDTGTRAAANAQANDFAISIETWDGGNPEGNPWNTAQLDAIDALLRWCCSMHGIPKSQPSKWDGAGIGYHRMFPEWDQPVHSCPGNTRAAQFPGIIIRLSQQPPQQEQDDMTNMVTCTDSLGRHWTFWLAGTALHYHVAGASEQLPGAWLAIAQPQTGPGGVIDISGWGVDFKPYGLHDDGSGWGQPFSL